MVQGEGGGAGAGSGNYQGDPAGGGSGGGNTGAGQQGGQGRGGGAAGGLGGGFGQGGLGNILQFRYRLVGFSQSTRQEYDLLQTGYTYSSADDAVSGGREKADNNLEVVRVFGEPSISGFASKQFTYSERLTEQTNREAAERDKAIRDAQDNPDTLDLSGDGAGGDDGLGAETGPPWLIIAIIAVVLIVVIALFMKGGS